MNYDNVEPGDIIFFKSLSGTNSGFARKNMRNQWWLSCLSFSCCGVDHQKTHVAICVGKEEDGSIKVAHLRANGYQISPLGGSMYQMKSKKDSFVIVRPRNEKFKQELIKSATLKENEKIKWDCRIYDNSVACCGGETKTDKTTNGFSIQSTCSRFVLEVVNMAAAKNLNRYLLTINKQNLNVMQLFWALKSSKEYLCLDQYETIATVERKLLQNTNRQPYT